MKKNFTQLIFSKISKKQYIVAFASLLMVLLSQVTMAQTINPTNGLNPSCATMGQSFVLTINGTGFSTGANNVMVQASVVNSGVTTVVTEILGTSNNGTQITITIPANSPIVSSARTLELRVANRSGNSSNFSFNGSAPASLTINGATNVGEISGLNTLCAGTKGVVYSVAPVNGAQSYSWTLPTGATVVSGANTNRITVDFANNATSGTVTVAARNACNTAGTTSTLNININPLPAAPNTISASRCGTGTVTLSAQGAPTGGSYRWYTVATGGTAISGATAATYSPSLASTTTYYVSTVSAAGCESATRTAVTATINPLPTVSITTNLASEYCTTDQTIVLAGSPSGAGGSFRILKDGIEVATGAAFNPGTLGAGTYVIEYSYTDGNTCTNTATKSVRVKQQPVITVSSNLEICAGQSATLTASGADSYIWSPATGLSSTSGANVTASPTQTTTYTVIGVTEGCQSVAKTVTVTVNPLPDVEITLRGPAVFCPENYVDLVAVNNPNYSYQWFRLNDSGSSTAVAASAEGPYVYQATQTGNYYVTITTDKGCVLSSETVAVKVANVPTKATFSITGATTFCEGGSVRFSANQSPTSEPYTYQWQKSTDGNVFDDIEGALASTYTANASGFYRVLVSNTAESSEEVEKCTKISDAVEVTVILQPTAQILGGNQTVCTDPDGVTSFFIEGVYTGGVRSWSTNKGGWNIVEVTDPETGKTSVRVDVAAGNPATSAVVTLKSSNSTSACTTALSSITLSVQPIPNTTITANRSTTLCKGEAVVLTANPGTGNYVWSTGETTRSITVFEAGSYTVKVTNSYGCDITSAPTAVTVNELPVVSIVSDLKASYCKSEAAVTLAGSPASGTFRILRGTTVVVTNATELNPGTLAAGTYIVEYSYTDGNTCTNKVSKQVTINALPVVNIVQPSLTSYCLNHEAITLAGNYNSGNFTINGQAATVFNPSTLGVGTHTVTYSYTDGNSCTNTVSKSVTVTPLPAKPTISNLKATYYTGDAPVIMQVSPSSATGGTFTVRNASGQTVSTSSTFSPCTLGVGTYNVTYTYTSGGCSNTSDPVTVRIIQSIYKAVVTSSMKPFCRGDNVTHTVRVWRDAEVIYPYLTNAAGDPVRADGSLVGPQELPVANPAYPFPANTPDIIKQYSWRYFDPIVKGGVEVTSGITYQWTKNQEPEIGEDKKTFTNAGLSSLDYYGAYVTVGGGSCGPNFSERISSRAYTAEQADYTIALSATPNPVCQGQPVTFTATLDGDFPWASSNLQLNWLVNGVVQHTTAYTGDNAALQWTVATLKDGDAVSIDFNTDIEGFDKTSKCRDRSNSNVIEIDVNDIVTATATPKTPTICAGASEVFSFVVNATGTNEMSYNWTVGTAPNAKTYTTTTPSLTITADNSFAPGTYPVSVLLSNTCETINMDLGSLTIKAAPQLFTLSGNGSYCTSSNPDGVEVTLNGSEIGVNYQLMLGSNPIGAPMAGTGNALNFGKQPSGTYSIVATFPNTVSCPTTMTGRALISAIPPTVKAGELKVTWNPAGTEWTVEALQYSPYGETAKYEWFTRTRATPENPWVLNSSSTTSTLIVENPPLDLEIMARITRMDDICEVYELNNIGVTPLPVELIYLKAEKQGKDVRVEWATASEDDNKGFEVQVSQDGKTFRTLSFVASKDSDSRIKQVYEYLDTENGKYGTRYYRLKQIDNDGDFEYFGAKAITFEVVANKIKVYPNPFESEMELSIDAEVAGEVEITVTSSIGQQILQRTMRVEKGVNVEKMILDPSLPRGMYIVTTRMGDLTSNFKLLKK
ncbi:T9SS type A sorting domain-containing protein [Pontibacter ruber]|uniref:T9SS type A sorting domain-containing protein n=1 Tax=Pontibacter ruber TaxID=1343895 RepID=A0ABW5CVD1_9BACT|nr:T9SS type A sorting domain-containing protein [Pontibacter ruber]